MPTPSPLCIAFICKQFPVEIDGETLDVIYGNHSDGGFCCILNRGICSEMPTEDDIHTIAEKLSKKTDLRTAYAVACKIKEICGNENVQDPVSEHTGTDNTAILNLPWTTALNLSARAHNCLARNGHPLRGGKELRTVKDVAELSLPEIHCMRNAGVVTRSEIAHALKNIGIISSPWFAYLDIPKPVQKPKKTPVKFTNILEVYFGDPECRAAWTKWSNNVRASNRAYLWRLKQEGVLDNSENVQKLRASILAGDLFIDRSVL